MPSVHVVSENENRIIQCLPGENLLESLRQHGIDVNAACGGKGTCGKCKVHVELFSRGTENSLQIAETEKRSLTPEEIRSGIRLACQVLVTQNMRVTVKTVESEVQILTDGFLPDYPKDDIGNPGEYGVATDIGTTTIACCLVNLATGEICRRGSGANPQIRYGMDVLTRISYEQTHPDNGVLLLQEAVVSGINDIIRQMCREEGIDNESVIRISVSANCTMMHMLLGVNAESIGRAPFVPTFTESRKLRASDLGLTPSHALVYCLPSVSSYIGADIVSGIYVCNLRNRTGNVLFIDIGTNGELVLSRDGAMNSCSCAAGPALEGMNISCGMRGESGAVQRVFIRPNGVKLDVIGNTEPRGVCGSGILSALKELLRIGVVRRSGAFLRKERIPEGDYRANLVKVDEEGRRYVLLYSGVNEHSFDPKQTEITVTQQDVRQLQLAKGAILSGFRALLRNAGLEAEELDEILVAGQFGSHLCEEDLTGTGILPACVQDRIRYVGNTSLTGAVTSLLSKKARADMEELADVIQYTELGATKDYQYLLAECMEFPEENHSTVRIARS